MNYSEFQDAIQQEVKAQFDAPCTVCVQSVLKNNGVRQQCLMILQPDDRVSPNIYLQSLYDTYQEGATIPELAGRIIEIYHSCRPDPVQGPDIDFSPENVRRQVVFRIINYERNRELLENVPHLRFLDLALVYHVLVSSRQFGDGAVQVRNDHLQTWDIPEEELRALARDNTKRLLPSEFMGIGPMLEELGRAEGAHSYDDIETEAASMDAQMYVLTNKDRQFGACYMADTDTLAEISDRLSDDLYLLPSSIHECMVLPGHTVDDPEMLARMVREINRMAVEEDEFLADSVYLYQRKSGEVGIAA